MVNVDKLKKVITQKGETIESVANAVNIDKSTLYRRLSSRGEDFSIAEVNGICSFLKMSQKDRKTIFFANDDA